MIEIFTQIQDGKLIPASREYAEELKAYKQNQLVKCRISGTRKARSVKQNKWLHAMFRLVAKNTDDQEWNTPERVKFSVKKIMNFYKYIVVEGSKVYFEFRSFAFDQMEHNEANVKYEDAKNICAKKLGVSPEVLEAKAKEETMTQEEWKEYQQKKILEAREN